MANTASSHRPGAEPRRPRADETIDEREIPHFESLTLPDLVSAEALFPAWLRRLFQKKPHAA